MDVNSISVFSSPMLDSKNTYQYLVSKEIRGQSRKHVISFCLLLNDPHLKCHLFSLLPGHLRSIANTFYFSLSFLCIVSLTPFL